MEKRWVLIRVRVEMRVWFHRNFKGGFQVIELLCILIVVVAACVLSCVGFFLTPQTTRLLCPWDYPGKNTEVICHFLLQGIFSTQRLNPCLLHPLHWQADSLPLKGRESVSCSAAAAKSLQSCPTLCDPRDGSPPGSPVPGILQAGTLEWVAISFSNAWKWKVKVKSLSRVWLLATPWTAAYQALLSMGFRSVVSHSLQPQIFQARILEWVAIPFSGRSSQTRGWTWVSCIAGRFFTIWATREAPLPLSHLETPLIVVVANKPIHGLKVIELDSKPPSAGAKGEQGKWASPQSSALAVDMSNVKHSFIFPISNHSGTPKLFPNGNNGAGYYPHGLPWWLSGKESTYQCRRCGLNPWTRKIPGGGNGNLLQYSCLGNPMDWGTWWAKVHGIARVIRDLVTKEQQTSLRPPFPPFVSQLALQNAKETF